MNLVIYLFLLLSSLQVLAGGERFMAEASGLARVGKTLVIAGDEDSRVLWVQEGESVKKLRVDGGKWDDLEDLAGLDSEHFFGVTSHSLTKNGQEKAEREQLLLFTKGHGISVKASWNLREKILERLEETLAAELDLHVVRHGTHLTGGLNVEGLAYLSGKLYLGLRSPVTRHGEAILIEVNDPTSAPTLGKVRKLPLRGKGIRGLETFGNRLLVLSGTVDDSDTEFGLELYDLSTAKLAPLNVPGFSNLMRPEAVVIESPGSILFAQDFEAWETQDVLVRLNYAR